MYRKSHLSAVQSATKRSAAPALKMEKSKSHIYFPVRTFSDPHVFCGGSKAIRLIRIVHSVEEKWCIRNVDT
ncbi:hypothetical protein NHQ30_000014 [Ciborinia camelliae]|nr:hypothetical protein NHQ30_000014 [Ciborinia camelliae]